MVEMDNILHGLNEILKVGPANDFKTDSTIQDITSGKLKLVSVLESLGDILTNEEVSVRERGLDLFSWIVSKLPSDLLNEREVSVIVDFYCDRLKDHHSLIPTVLNGFLALVQMSHLPQEKLILMLTQLFQHVNCQRQLQADRYKIYSIFKVLFEKKLDVVKVMGPDFVFGVISFTEGETDPENLLLVFQSYPLFLEGFPLGHLNEEMFEVMSCYFPVDFNAAERNNVVITRDDLAVSLARCLSCQTLWADLCIPLILDKLDSSLKTAKLDSYKLLQDCSRVYTVDQFEKHLNEVWKAIQRDVFPGSDKDVCTAALNCLADIGLLLSSQPDKEHVLMNFLGDVTISVTSLMGKVDDSLFQPAMNVLLAVCSKSSRTTHFMLTHFRPLYSSGFAKTTTERKMLLAALKCFLVFCKQAQVALSSDSRTRDSYSELCDLFLTSMTCEDQEARVLSFQGVQTFYPDLDESSRANVYSALIDNVEIEGSEAVRVECVGLLRLAATLHADDLTAATLERLWGLAPRSLPALAALAPLAHFTHIVIPRLTDMIRSGPHLLPALQSFLAICKVEDGESQEMHRRLVSEFDALSVLVAAWSQSAGEGGGLTEAMQLAAQAVHLLVKALDTALQRASVDKFVPGLVLAAHVPNGGGDFQCGIQPDLNVVLLEAILGSVRPEVLARSAAIEPSLRHLAVGAEDSAVRVSACRLLACFINKLDEAAAADVFETTAKDLLTAVERKVHVAEHAELFTWAMKGALLRHSPQLDTWTALWFQLLARDDVGAALAAGFRTIMEQDESYLDLSSHANVKILYRQRLFMSLPKLMALFRSAEESAKETYLLAISHLIQGVPKHLVTGELGNVVVLLARALQSENTEVLTPGLRTTLSLLEEREKLLGDHVASFLPRLLALARFTASMQIRTAALQCLFHYAFYPTVIMLPFKTEVVRDLGPCLDDKKRLVRSEAVKTRSRWYLVGAPGEDTIFAS